MLERAELELILPHRGRALLLDKAEVTDTGAVGFLTVREDIVEGHFPGNPIMRGFDRAEMLVQTLGVAANVGLPEGYLAYLAEADGLKWPGMAVLGDLVRTEVIISRKNRRIVEGKGIAYVEDRIVAVASSLKFVIGRASNQS